MGHEGKEHEGNAESRDEIEVFNLLIHEKQQEASLS